MPLFISCGFPANRNKIESRRADSNRLPLLQLRVIGHALQAFAEVCKSRISRRLSLLRVALCCTVLRSRWYQIGIRTSDRYSLMVDPMAHSRNLLWSHNPPTPVSRRCSILQNQLREADCLANGCLPLLRVACSVVSTFVTVSRCHRLNFAVTPHLEDMLTSKFACRKDSEVRKAAQGDQPLASCSSRA